MTTRQEQLDIEQADEVDPGATGRRWRAMAVHVLTASGVVAAFFAMAELFRETPDARIVFLWLIVATLIDAIDGPFARWCHVKRYAPSIDGRTIDDIVDYLTFTFIPLLLVYRLGWLALPQPWSAVWVVAPMIASLLGFANSEAKDEAAGYFRGFPSYWNIAAFYLGLSHWHFGDGIGGWFNALVLIVLAVLTVAPVRFLYPNLAPWPWRLPVMIGAGVWLVLLLAMLPTYPRSPAWLVWLSLVYPAFYAILSIVLDPQRRNRSAEPSGPS